MGFAALTPTYLERAARMRFGCDRSDFFRDDYLVAGLAGKFGTPKKLGPETKGQIVDVPNSP